MTTDIVESRSLQGVRCEVCGFMAKNNFGLGAHSRIKHGIVRDAATVTAPVDSSPVQREPTSPEPRSRRGRARRDRDMRMLSPLEQIRGRPGLTTGPWAYYINPKGATIRDALILYPNGAQLSREEDPRGRHSENASYYQQRQAAKGLEYIGPTLTERGVRRLVEVLEDNKEDEALDLEEQIADCAHDIANSDRPEWRDNQRKRRDQLQRRLDYVRTPIDPVALVNELNDIAEAQKLARLDPAIVAALQSLRGEMRAETAAAIERFRSSGKAPAEDDAMNVGRAMYA